MVRSIGPGLADNQIAAGAFRNGIALHRDNLRSDPEKWLGRRAGFRRDRARNRGDHDGPGFRLPPGVDNRAAVVADEFAIPHPSFGIDGFADGAEQTQAFHFVFLRPFVSPLGESPNGGRRGIKNIDL